MSQPEFKKRTPAGVKPVMRKGPGTVPGPTGVARPVVREGPHLAKVGVEGADGVTGWGSERRTPEGPSEEWPLPWLHLALWTLP